MKALLWFSLLSTNVVIARSLEDSVLVVVPYEYKIEVNGTNMSEALSAFENYTISSLKNVLGELPQIEMLDVLTAQVEGCTSRSEDCQVFESSVSLALQSGDHRVVERATLMELEKIADSFSNNHTFVTFLGPRIVTASVVLRLAPINDLLNAGQAELLEMVLMQLFRSVGAQYVRVFWQQLVVNDGSFANQVFVRTQGQCRSCSSQDFESAIQDRVSSKAGLLEHQLEQDPYFGNITISLVTSSFSPTTDIDSFSTSHPGFLYKVWIVLSVGVLVFLSGICYARKARQRKHALNKHLKQTCSTEANDGSTLA